MKYLKVLVDTQDNFISIENDGDVIPIEIHKDHGIYVPELVFGHLLTSSNYDDSGDMTNKERGERRRRGEGKRGN
jgi:DNA topoisomerase-2